MSAWIGIGINFIVSSVAIIISIKAWTKSRAIYDIETTHLRGDTIKIIRDKLATGKYTILNVYTEGQFPKDDIRLILGKIKK